MQDKWRTPEAAEYRRMYRTKHWQYLRKQALLRDGYTCQHKGCGVHLRLGRRGDNAAVVHHIKPHKGDPALFFDLSNLVCVCKRHHDGDIQSIEARGYDTEIGQDGWPIDPNHPGG